MIIFNSRKEYFQFNLKNFRFKLLKNNNWYIDMEKELKSFKKERKIGQIKTSDKTFTSIYGIYYIGKVFKVILGSKTFDTLVLNEKSFNIENDVFEYERILRDYYHIVQAKIRSGKVHEASHMALTKNYTSRELIVTTSIHYI